MGQNVWVDPKWKEGFWEFFYHRRHGKIKKGSKPNKSPKPKRVFFLKTKTTKKFGVSQHLPLRNNLVPEISADP